MTRPSALSFIFMQNVKWCYACICLANYGHCYRNWADSTSVVARVNVDSPCPLAATTVVQEVLCPGRGKGPEGEN